MKTIENTWLNIYIKQVLAMTKFYSRVNHYIYQYLYLQKCQLDRNTAFIHKITISDNRNKYF